MTGRKHLVVLDDNVDFARLVGRVARAEGFSVSIPANAAAFREAVRDDPPTTIVLDIVMPDADGTELVVWLAENGYSARVVLVTGFEPLYSKMAERLGAARGLLDIVRLQKPVSLEDLRSAFR